MRDRNYQICANCVMDTSDPEISFDEKGFCDFCNNYYTNILPNWHTDEQGKSELIGLFEKIKKSKGSSKYDCILGMSGGVDSSYLAYVAKKEFGLNPLLLTVDCGWNLNVSNENIFKLCSKLELDLETIVVNWEEMKDLQVAFFKSQVPYQDTPQDHAIFAGMYNYAVKNGYKYILTGGNYSTEGAVKPPQEWTYLNDLKFIKDIHRRFGSKPLATFPLCGIFTNRLYYRYIKGLRVVHPLNMIPYHKDDAVKVLQEKVGWEEYKNKHYDNVFTRFYEGYWLLKKFGYDKRKCYFSNLILTNQMTREDALVKLKEDPYDEKTAQKDLTYVAEKLDMSKKDFLELMSGENKTYRDYRNNAYLIKTAIKIAKNLGLERRNFR